MFHKPHNVQGRLRYTRIGPSLQSHPGIPYSEYYYFINVYLLLELKRLIIITVSPTIFDLCFFSFLLQGVQSQESWNSSTGIELSTMTHICTTIAKSIWYSEKKTDSRNSVRI